MSKRIIFSTATPNDQGGVIPNNVIDFSRFNKNPVMLKQHNWNADPIGMWKDIRLEGNKWTGEPVFHGLTEESTKTKDLFDKGFIRAASIGGEAIWKQNAAGQYEFDKEGNRICVKFYLYEISIVTLPSNEDAVQEDAIELHAKIYEHNEIENISQTLTTLSLKFNSNTMITKKEFEKLSAEEKTAKIEEMKALIADSEASPEEKKNAKETLSSVSADGTGLPKWLKEIIGLGGKLVFGAEQAAASAPAPKDKPESTQQKEKEITAQPKPTGLKSKKAAKAESEMEKAKEKAEEAVKKVKECKEKAEKDDATEEDKAEYKKAKEEAEEAASAYEAAEKAHKKATEADDDDDEDEEDEKESSKTKNNSAKTKTTNSAMKPEIKTAQQVKDELKLAAAPSHAARVRAIGAGKTFSQLAASKEENDKRLMGRVLTNDGGTKDIADYAAVLNAIMADGKYKALVDKTRIMMNVAESQIGAFQANPNARAGISLQELASQFGRGEIDMMGRDNVMRKISTLSSTDNALASPALNTIEWLSLAIFKLFPNSSWKNEIPIFGAEMTGKNTGVIWANVAADPTIYKGAQPSNPASYSYSDTAVSLSLTPYWLQPMLWTPLTMHQLRYDQMGTGWAQAFAKWNSVIDDNLIYTLASTVPAASIVTTSGLSGYQTNPITFPVGGNAAYNKFYYNPSFTGSLLAPVLNDITTLEQIYNYQNFELSGEKPTLVLDPIMDAMLKKDPETKSLLTRWVNQDGGEFVKFGSTILPQRSRVAIYDPATGQVKDPNGTIPSTAISAALGFIPSQIGMGLGMLDVFMIQDPTSYGYRMSADIRMGIAPLRADFSGTSLLTYGAVSNPSNA